MVSLSLTGQLLKDALAGVSASVQKPELDLKRLQERFDNATSVETRLALEAIHCGRAAYWTTTRYQSARSGILLNKLNGGDTFSAALDHAYDDCDSNKRVEALDRLIPLNRMAANDLIAAYEEFGLWREVEELERRAA